MFAVGCDFRHAAPVSQSMTRNCPHVVAPVSRTCFENLRVDVWAEVEMRDSDEALLLDVATTHQQEAHVVTDGLASPETGPSTTKTMFVVGYL